MTENAARAAKKASKRESTGVMMQIYPMKLSGVTKSPIWGGTRLLKNWNKISDAPTVGESWELTVREKEMSLVQNGVYAGERLCDIIAADTRAMMGETRSETGFPLLIKLIDATDRLSVQVHPDDVYAETVENDRGKTEMWYIVEADEGAEIIMGLAEGKSVGDFAADVAVSRVEEGLRHVKVRPGETYFIPAGLPHAIGRGILIAEIQQNCDLTYRVYDYERRQPDGSLRRLHVKKALDVIRPFSADEIDAIRFSRGRGEASLLADCDYFRVEKRTAKAEGVNLPDSRYLRHLLILSGTGSVTANGVSVPYAKGESILLPAGAKNVNVAGSGELILSTAY